jgi:hypothetical protein
MSTKWRDVKRKMFRRFRKSMQKHEIDNFYQITNSRKRSRAFEIYLFLLFLEGTRLGEEYTTLCQKNQKYIIEKPRPIDIALRPNYWHFSAGDLPIFVTPKIFDLLQESLPRTIDLIKD